jgi:N utilization substance protein A
MSSELLQAIEALGREKGIDKEIVIAALEDAMAAAAKRVLHSQEAFVGHFDRETGEMHLARIKTVVEGPELENPLTEMLLKDAKKIRKDAAPGEVLEFPLEATPYMGRIAAQQAKQVLTQKIREAEREIIYKEYKDRVGTVINGVVKRTERRNVIVDIGRTEALLPVSEQCRGERFLQNDRIRALIIDVRENTKGSQIILSRGAKEFVAKLFEAEVPEIYDGTVVIRAIAREAGERTKLAVQSRDRDIDPIGACIGMRGMRVQAVTRELRGEKIDIIPFKEELSDMVKAALAPATVTRVQIVDQEAKRMEVIVPEDQLSLTIGKRGQNIRLAGVLVGWELDVKSEEAKKQEILAAMSSMMGGGEEVSEELPEGAEQESAEGEEDAAPQEADLEAGAEGKAWSEEAAPEASARTPGQPVIPGVPEKVAAALAEAGMASPEAVRAASDEQLLAIAGLGPKTLEHLRAWAAEAGQQGGGV